VQKKKLIISFTQLRCIVGISDSAIPGNSLIGEYSNSYAIHIVGHPCYGCRLAGERHRFELPVGAIRPKIKHYGNVYGCGLVLDPEDKLWIFFTFNGQLFCEFLLVLRIKKILCIVYFQLINFDIRHTIIIYGALIIINLQVGKFQSVPRWIASFQQSQ
jgi:hypothetical protein